MEPSSVAPLNRGDRLVLGFDAGCLTCSGLAARIEDAAGEGLEVRPLNDPQVGHWRKTVFGEEAPWAPTLVEIKGGKVKAWTGVRMSVALSRRLGPVATWRVLQALGGTEPSSERPDARAADGLSRGQFIKGLTGGLVAFSVLPAGRALAADRKVGEVSTPVRLPAGSATVGWLKRFRAVKTAGGRFGKPDWSGVTRAEYEEDGERRTMFAIPYDSSGETGTTLLVEDELAGRAEHSPQNAPDREGQRQDRLLSRGRRCPGDRRSGAGRTGRPLAGRSAGDRGREGATGGLRAVLCVLPRSLGLSQLRYELLFLRVYA